MMLLSRSLIGAAFIIGLSISPAVAAAMSGNPTPPAATAEPTPATPSTVAVPAAPQTPIPQESTKAFSPAGAAAPVRNDCSDWEDKTS